MARVRVLMVCYANLCRSPMAEAVLRHRARLGGYGDAVEVDSAGNRPYLVGGPAHPGTLEVLARKGIDATGLACRGVVSADFRDFDRILAVDRQNLALLEKVGVGPARVDLLLPYGTSGELDVPDPFVVGGFGHVYDLVDDACRGLLADLQKVELARP